MTKGTPTEVQTSASHSHCRLQAVPAPQLPTWGHAHFMVCSDGALSHKTCKVRRSLRGAAFPERRFLTLLGNGCGVPQAAFPERCTPRGVP